MQLFTILNFYLECRDVDDESILWNIVVGFFRLVCTRGMKFLDHQFVYLVMVVLKIVQKHRGSAHVAEESRDLRIYRVSRCVSTERSFSYSAESQPEKLKHYVHRTRCIIYNNMLKYILLL